MPDLKDLKDTSVCGTARPHDLDRFCEGPAHSGDSHTDQAGDTYSTVPLIGDEALIAERLRLALLDVEALNAELEPARYVVGPSECADPEDRSCDEYDGPDTEWCSHVEHRIATFADVKARHALDAIVQSFRAKLTEVPDAAAEWAKDVAERIDNALEESRDDLRDIGGLQALSVSDLHVVLAEIREEHRQWREDPQHDLIKSALNRASAAERRETAARRELRELRAAATPGGAEGSAVPPSVASEGLGVAAQHPEGGDRG